MTSALFNEDNIVDDHGDLDVDNGGRGYMMDPKDWRDVEVDFMFKVKDYTSTNGFIISVGGGRHTNPQPFCEGSAYLLRLYYDGSTQMLKEQWHNNKVPIPFEDSNESPFPPGADFTEDGIIKDHIVTQRDVWYYFKFVRYNIKGLDGKTSVKLEAYLNLTGDKKTWERFYSVTDTSGWGRSGDECNGERDQVLNWGYPMVRIEWKNATRVDWFGLHVREIQPTAPIPEDPDDNSGGGGGGDPGGGGGGGGQPEIPPAEQPTGLVEKIGSFRFSIASALATSCDGIEPANPPTDPPPGGGDPGGGNPPPPAGSATVAVYWSDYWRVGS